MINWDNVPFYNEATNNLKVAYSETDSLWYVCCYKGVYEFENEIDMDGFLRYELLLSDDNIDEGFICFC